MDKKELNNVSDSVVPTIAPIPQPPMSNTKSNPNDKNTKDTVPNR